MSQTPGLTKKQRDNQAKRKALGIATIAKPLRYITSKTMITDGDGKRHESPEAKAARYAANRGDSLTVKRIARSL